MSDPLKAIIVEDEASSRETLKNYLGKYCPDVNLMTMADSVESAYKAILKYQPDLVFLDIEMPYGNAFDLLAKFEDIDFEIVFVTAYRDYAMRALNLSAAYYILKPIDIDELIKAVDIIKKNKEADQEAIHTKILLQNMKSVNHQQKKIVLPQMDGFEVVKIMDIIKGEASDNYTTFYLTNGRKYVVSKTLKFFEDLLTDFDFSRVHKSFLVNIQHITKYKKGKGGEVIMVDGSSVPVSPLYKSSLLKNFK
jgi:two-component system LytT family response regulator